MCRCRMRPLMGYLSFRGRPSRDGRGAPSPTRRVVGGQIRPRERCNRRSQRSPSNRLLTSARQPHAAVGDSPARRDCRTAAGARRHSRLSRRSLAGCCGNRQAHLALRASLSRGIDSLPYPCQPCPRPCPAPDAASPASPPSPWHLGCWRWRPRSASPNIRHRGSVRCSPWPPSSRRCIRSGDRRPRPGGRRRSARSSAWRSRSS